VSLIIWKEKNALIVKYDYEGVSRGSTSCCYFLTKATSVSSLIKLRAVTGFPGSTYLLQWINLQMWFKNTSSFTSHHS